MRQEGTANMSATATSTSAAKGDVASSSVAQTERNVSTASTSCRDAATSSLTSNPKDTTATSDGQKRATNLNGDSTIQNHPAKPINEECRFAAFNILARNYVPQHMKAINQVQVTCIIPTLEPPKSEVETERVFRGLMRHSLACECTGEKGKNCHALPAKILALEEHSFARNQMKKRNGAAVPPISMSSGRDAYIQTFRELMQLEYEAQSKLFERYSQYEVEIFTTALPLTEKKKHRHQLVAKFRVSGIADGRPSVQPGDLVLIRPYGVVPNPYHLRRSYPKCSPNTAPPPVMLFPGAHQIPYHRVEIRAKVVQVVRGKPSPDKELRKDLVIINWCVDPTLAMSMLSQDRRFTVRFVPSTSSHERALTAFRWLETLHPTIAKDLLFPTETPKLPPTAPVDESDVDYDSLELEYMQLNENQTKFVRMMITRTENPAKESVRSPIVLTGPAGTGKTKTLLVAVLQCMKRIASMAGREPHILVCTPSHTACDVITLRLAKLLTQLQKNDSGQTGNQGPELQQSLFRLYDVSRNVSTVPVEVLQFTKQNSKGQFILPSTQRLLEFQIIVTTCEDAHLLFMGGMTNKSLRVRRQCLKTTLELSMKAAKLDGVVSDQTQPHFTHLFIDEAAQATEPESLIPLSVVVDDSPDIDKVEIALCGDPRQLSPNIYSGAASDILQRSLLERLLRLPVATYGGGRDTLLGPPTRDSWQTLDELIEYSFQKKDCHDHLSVFLNQSYRGHPSFLIMPSKLFYFDKLKSVVRVADESFANTFWLEATARLQSMAPQAYPPVQPEVRREWPMLFRGVKGKDATKAVESFFGSNSWSNQMEAMAITEMIEALVTQQGVSTASVGVMAAFRAQVVLIRRLLRERNLGAVNVGIPEDYQSVERDIIMLSLTRSSTELVEADKERRTGLFHQPKRTNVALTRAEHLLVVVGNPDTMMEDPIWKDWMVFCRENGLWYGERETPLTLD